MDYDKREKNKFYDFIDAWHCGEHHNYKTLLAGLRKEAKARQEKVDRSIKSIRKQIKQLEVELN